MSCYRDPLARSVSWFVILRACYRARKLPNPENTKNIQNPPPRVDPRKYEKIPKKYKNGPKIAVVGPFSYFFRYFFRIFGGQPGVGDFVFFSYFWALGGSGLCSRPARSQLLVLQASPLSKKGSRRSVFMWGIVETLRRCNSLFSSVCSSTDGSFGLSTWLILSLSPLSLKTVTSFLKLRSLDSSFRLLQSDKSNRGQWVQMLWSQGQNCL